LFMLPVARQCNVDIDRSILLCRRLRVRLLIAHVFVSSLSPAF
jgi:hypothetical protein